MNGREDRLTFAITDFLRAMRREKAESDIQRLGADKWNIF